MPQGRILLRRISESRKLALLKTDGARLLYTWLIPHLQSNACFSGDPVVVNGKVFTRLNKPKEEVEGYLKDLEDVGLIKTFEANGDVFLCVLNFQQLASFNPSREGTPTIPTPEFVSTLSGQGQPNISKGKVIEGKLIYAWFESIWSQYPKKLGKTDALRHFKKTVVNEKDFEDIQSAVKNYQAYIRVEKVEEKFVKHGSTWFNTWRDWIPTNE